MESFKPLTKCRACKSSQLVKYLSLGNIPLSNNLDNTKQESFDSERYLLEIVLCEDCGLSQLSIIVDPEKLYSHYMYRSSINKGYVEHCRKMAKTLKTEYGLDSSCFHIDIASNDGALLKEFNDEIGLEILGIDPAKNLARIAQEGGVPTLDDFWTVKLAKSITEVCGKAHLITATNVFAHIDDMQGFLIACHESLHKNGILVIECPYYPKQLDSLDYTQTYFEHLSYITLSPIYDVCKTHQLKVIDATIHPIHGGSIRIIIAKEESVLVATDNVRLFLDYEYDSKLTKSGTYFNWVQEVNESIKSIQGNIADIILKGQKIAGFSASAKGNILLNTTQLSQYLDYIVDETPEKIGKYSPGTGLKIVGMDILLNDPPDYLLLLSYNFKDEIIKKVKELGYKGRFILPIPKFEIIE
jgi:hypothetical protein